MDIPEAIERAIANALHSGLNDVFEEPFELRFLEQAGLKAEVFQRVKSCIESGNLQLGPIFFTGIPKGKSLYDFRRCALIDPLDYIKYLALTLLCAEIIETHRIEKSSEQIFSYRFEKRSDGGIFDPDCNYDRFLTKTQAKILSEDAQVVVKCDIANFYDRLNLHRLESTLEALGIEKRYRNALNQMLLHWARRDSYGLPVGSNASRLLAEAALIDVDNYLVSIGANFIRYVDDYRFFTADAATGQYYLYRLMERLAQDGLTLNSAKTKLLSGEQELEELETRRSHAKEARKSVKTPDTKPLKADEYEFGSYGSVPRFFFKKRAADENQADANTLFAAIRNEIIIKYDDFTRLTQAIVDEKHYELLNAYPELLTKCPPFIQYVTDMLIKQKDEIPQTVRQRLSTSLSTFLNPSKFSLPDWYRLAIVRLIATQEYKNKAALLSFLRSMPRDSAAYIGRVTLDLLLPYVTRGDAIALKAFFEKADRWERRGLLRLLKTALPEEESIAWAKYAREHMKDDPFGMHIVRPYAASAPLGATP